MRRCAIYSELMIVDVGGPAMNQLSVFRASNGSVPLFYRQLSRIFKIEFRQLEDLAYEAPGQYTVFDLDLREASQIASLKEWLKAKPHGAKVVFLVDNGSRIQETRAYAIGATDVLHRPIDGRRLLAKLWSEASSLSVGPNEHCNPKFSCRFHRRRDFAEYLHRGV